MAVPRNRSSNAAKNQRRSHHAKVPKQLRACPNCRKFCLPHTICPSCGCYGNKVVIATK